MLRKLLYRLCCGLASLTERQMMVCGIISIIMSFFFPITGSKILVDLCVPLMVYIVLLVALAYRIGGSNGGG